MADADVERIVEQLKFDLIKCIRCEDSRKLKTILSSIRSAGYDWINEPLNKTGYNALHLCVISGFEDGVVQLMNFGVDINGLTEWHETAVHLAVQNEYVSILETLLEHATCDPTFKSRKNNETALHIAARLGCLSAVKLLLTAAPESINMQDKEGNTPLHCAVLSSQEEIMRELLDKGANQTIQNGQRHTARYISMKIKNDNNLTKILTCYKSPQENNVISKNGSIQSKMVTINPNKWNNKDANAGGNAVAAAKPRQNGVSRQNLLPTDKKPLNKGVFITQLGIKAEDGIILNRKHTQFTNQQPQSPKTQESVNVVSVPVVQVQPKETRPEYPINKANNFSKVVQTQSPLLSDDFYKMKTTPRGICILINIETYWHEDFKERRGADIDEKRLYLLFQNLNFKVKIHKNINATEIFWVVANLSQSEELNNYDCFVCCILCHGDLGVIYGTDGDRLPISDLIMPLTSQKCKALAGKPKVFFIQSCRGKDYQSGVQMEHDASISNEINRIIPDHADFLLSYATVAGYRAHRNPTTGSIYIQGLCEILEREYQHNDLLSILTKVNASVSKNVFDTPDGYSCTQISEVRHTLTKKIFFG